MMEYFIRPITANFCTINVGQKLQLYFAFTKKYHFEAIIR